MPTKVNDENFSILGPYRTYGWSMGDGNNGYMEPVVGKGQVGSTAVKNNVHNKLRKSLEVDYQEYLTYI